ncbi:MAG: hypothetical protein J6583_14665, partial [Gilliamella sp.]|nr:hypothetical protein [Gilliamella sp.]
MIALSPILVLSLAIIVFLSLLFAFKLSTKGCAILTVCGLTCALICSVMVGYKISFSTQAITDISSDNMQISASISEPAKEQIRSSEETIAIDTVSTETTESSNEDETLNIDSNTEDNSIDNKNIDTNSNFGDNSNIDDESTDEWKAHHITALFTCDGYGLLYT